MTELTTAQNTDLTTHTETNPALVYLAGLSPTGRRTMASTLRNVATMLGSDPATMPWASLRYEHMVALKTKLAEAFAPATVNKYLSAVRGTLHAAWRMGQLDAEAYQRAVDVEGAKGSTLPAGRSLSHGEIEALMRTCANDPTPAGVRDAAIIAVAYAGGLRRAELSGLSLEDLEDDGETVTLRVQGKGGKERYAYLDNGAALTVRDWLRTRGDAPGALFHAGRKGGRLNAGQRLVPQSIRDMVHRRAEQAGIPSCSPHDLRRSCATVLLELGHDLATVAAMLGHANVETTRRYDRRGEQAKQRAARSLHVPYYGRLG